MDETGKPTDLIALKTAEYDNEPGLILGLDGWILRSVPKDLRAQFINGYEKLLRIVFHPDRYTNETQKLSRQTYLQAVADAARFMLSSEFNFEITSDSVPTKRNPIVALHNAIEMRDGIIERLDGRIKDVSASDINAREEVTRLKARLMEVTTKAEQRASADYHLRMLLPSLLKTFPVPLSLRWAQVKGRFVNFNPLSEFVTKLGHYSSESFLGDSNEWISQDSWVSELRHQKLLEPQVDLSFERSIAPHGACSFRIIGAMTIAHLCAYLRRQSGDLKTLPALDLVALIGKLFQPIPTNELMEEFRLGVFPFLLPYYSKNMLLLIRVREHQDGKALLPHHRLFVVTDVDAGEGPVKALAEGFERQAKALTKENSDLKDKLDKANKKLKKKITPPK